MLVTRSLSFSHSDFNPQKLQLFTRAASNLKCDKYLILKAVLFGNPLLNDQIFYVTKLKAFAGDKLNVDKMTMSLSGRIENTEGKGENTGYQHFLLFPPCFPKPSSFGVVKSRDCAA